MFLSPPSLQLKATSIVSPWRGRAPIYLVRRGKLRGRADRQW